MSKGTEENTKAVALAEHSLKEMAMQELGVVEKGLAELQTLYAGKVYDVMSTAGMDAAKKARLDIRERRYKVPKIVDGKKKEIKAIVKEIEGKGDTITEALFALENPIHKQITDEENRREQIKLEKERLAAERLANIRAKIADFTQFVLMAAGFNSIALTEHIAKIEAGYLAPADYAELLPEAQKAKDEVLTTLKAQLDALVQKEAEEKRLEEERVETARKAMLQARVDAIKRVAIDAASVQSIEELEKLQTSVGATDLADLEEYEGTAAEAVAQAFADIAAMIEQKNEAARLKELSAQMERDRLAQEAESNRKAKIYTLIGEIRNFPADCIGLDSATIRMNAENIMLGYSLISDAGREVYQEFAEEAEQVRTKAQDQVNVMIAAAETSEKAAETEAAAQKERDRVTVIKGLIADIKAWPIKCLQLNSQLIREEIESSEMDVPCEEEDFHEFTTEAENERIIALSTMNGMADAKEKMEAETARIAAEQKQAVDDAAAQQAEREAAVLVAEDPIVAPAADAANEAETITILKTEYDRLNRREAKLNALEAAGVDNWDGYDFAMEALEGEE